MSKILERKPHENSIYIIDEEIYNVRCAKWTGVFCSPQKRSFPKFTPVDSKDSWVPFFNALKRIRYNAVWVSKKEHTNALPGNLLGIRKRN